MTAKRKRSRRFIPISLCSLIILLGTLLFTTPLYAKEKFRIAWSIYVGWMPWEFGHQQGIVKKWADKYDIEIEVVRVNDYIGSINQYSTGAFDACAMTNMDALMIPAASGIDSTALIIGDFSNGNDAIVLKKKSILADIKGQKVNLVKFSVSHYLLARGLESVGLRERDIKMIDTSDANMVSMFASNNVTSAVTWNPLLREILAFPDTHSVFDSSQIPGEIIDLMVVNTETLKANPKLGMALTGAWYEIMAAMSQTDEKAIAARTHMARASGTDLAGFNAQLETTRMFYDAEEAVKFSRSEELIKTMEHVASFSFEHGLLGAGAADASFIGIAFPGEKSIGDKENIKLRFNESFMNLAAEGKL